MKTSILIFTFLISLGDIKAQDKACSEITNPLDPKTTNWFTDTEQLVADWDPARGQNTDNPVVISLSEPQAIELFNELASNSKIPFRFPSDGCYARAHEMALIMEKKGIASGKVFIEGDLRVSTPHHPLGYVKWVYHVAPTLNVLTNKGPITMVFDPSMFNRPVPLSIWVEAQIKHKPKKAPKIYFRKRFTYFPGAEWMRGKDEWSSADVKNAKEEMKKFSKIRAEWDKLYPWTVIKK